MSNQVGSITQRPMSTILPNNEDHGSNMIVLHWFRQGDLRLHDNPALVHSCKLAAAHKGGVVVPCFVFDSAIYGAEAITSNRTGSLKCGPRRAQFVTECVADLRQNLKEKCGSQLLIAHGDPAEIMDQWIQKLMQTTHNDNSITKNKCSISIVCQEEVVAEERRAVKAVQAVLKKYMPKNGKVQTIWGSTMYDIHDLPFDKELIDMPDVFTPFRNKVEKKSVIQKPFAAPHHGKIPFFANNSFAFDAVVEHMACMPTLQDLGYTSEQIEYAATVDSRGVMEFRGGESAALARMKDYIWDKDCLKDYFDTRNGMIGADYSTKFSPWLAHGCLSPRRVASECKRYEQERVENKSTYWVVFELLWRDFCKFFALKHGDAIFFPSGTVGVPRKWSHFEKNFEAWKLGLTGYPLVDANMREMLATGFMSNRGRQNVASFLTIDLAHDWRMGGDWFETNLLDYDVYSNWVNWCSAAGMTGGRLNRFNIVKQSKDYDQHGEYVRRWIPELKDVPTELVHEPWKMTQFHQTEYNVRLGVDYPNPIIPPSRPSGDGVHGKHQGKPQGRPNKGSNRHQRHEMKSLEQGRIQMK